MIGLIDITKYTGVHTTDRQHPDRRLRVVFEALAYVDDALSVVGGEYQLKTLRVIRGNKSYGFKSAGCMRGKRQETIDMASMALKNLQTLDIPIGKFHRRRYETYVF